MSRYISLAIVAVVAIFAIFTLQKQLHVFDAPKQVKKQTPVATKPKPTGIKRMNISMKTNHGTIMLELFPDKAPITVKNFVDYIQSGHFNGTVFHRVIPGFMIQGGGFVPGMTQKDTQDPIKNEADNGLANDIGTIAMARTPDPDSIAVHSGRT